MINTLLGCYLQLKKYSRHRLYKQYLGNPPDGSLYQARISGLIPNVILKIEQKF